MKLIAVYSYKIEDHYDAHKVIPFEYSSLTDWELYWNDLVRKYQDEREIYEKNMVIFREKYDYKSEFYIKESKLHETSKVVRKEYNIANNLMPKNLRDKGKIAKLKEELDLITDELNALVATRISEQPIIPKHPEFKNCWFIFGEESISFFTLEDWFNKNTQ